MEIESFTAYLRGERRINQEGAGLIQTGLYYDVVEAENYPGEWRVEAVNYDGDGEVYVTIFSGPLAEARAREYADWRNSGSPKTR
jgi:hypothetical protein